MNHEKRREIFQQMHVSAFCNFRQKQGEITKFPADSFIGHKLKLGWIWVWYLISTNDTNFVMNTLFYGDLNASPA